MELLKWSLIFLVALGALIKAANIFTDSAEKIGLHFRIPPFIIGVTIVALGTSLPELATSISAMLHNDSGIVVGDVVGSNIANILLVLAVTAIVGKHLYVDKEIKNVDLPILLGSAILLFIMSLDGKFTYIDGTICLFALGTYILYNIKSHRKVGDKALKEMSKEKKEKLHIKYYIYLLVTVAAIYLTSEWTIVSIKALSGLLSIGTEVIAASAVALVTSLPELVVSVSAAMKGKADIAIGNITGSNIFNALGVMGIPSFFGVIEIPPEMITFHIPALLFVTILYMFVTMDKEVTQWEGITLLILYVAFMGKTFGLI